MSGRLPGTNITTEEGTSMSKNQNVKKGSKKEPAKTMKEKKAAKRDKKNGKPSDQMIDQLNK